MAENLKENMLENDVTGIKEFKENNEKQTLLVSSFINYNHNFIPKRTTMLRGKKYDIYHVFS